MEFFQDHFLDIRKLILKEIKQEHEQLFKECELIINELNRCALCLNEEWIETIEASAKLYLNKDYNNMINQLIKMHKKIWKYKNEFK